MYLGSLCYTAWFVRVFRCHAVTAGRKTACKTWRNCTEPEKELLNAVPGFDLSLSSYVLRRQLLHKMKDRMIDLVTLSELFIAFTVKSTH